MCKNDCKSCISNNEKTIKTLDLSTNCPKRLAFELNPLGDVKPCSYCYVEVARKKGFNAKKVYETHYNGEILRMTKGTIEKLNAVGGLRVFSFGDYIEWMDADLMQIVEDAKKVGLKLKAITKQVEFVHKFAQYFDIVHISIDNVGDGVEWSVAKDLKARYSNVLVRCAIMSDNDLSVMGWADIYTFNHADNGYRKFSPQERVEFAQQYPTKVCCETSKCASCKIKCGGAK